MNTTSSLIIVIALAIGMLVLASSVAYGILGYNPDDAHAIRQAEADQQQFIVEEVRRIHVRAPERFRHDRLDRHFAWLALMFAAQGYSVCVLAGAEITSNVRILDAMTRTIMAGSFLVGSFLCLVGASMGARFWRWRLAPDVHDNLTSPMLADDIRLPYTLGGVGAAVMAVSTGTYSTTSFHSTVGSLGGWMTGCFSFACLGMIAAFYTRVKRYERARELVINRAVAQIESNDHG